MKWKPVKGRGDTRRGISFPDELTPINRMPPKTELGYQMDSYVDESRRKWARNATAAQWARESRSRAASTPRDSPLGRPHPGRGGAANKIAWITHTKPKPQSVLKNIYLGSASYVPNKRG